MRLIRGKLRSSPRRAVRDLLWLGLAALAVSLVAFALNIPQLIYNPVRGLARAMVK